MDTSGRVSSPMAPLGLSGTTSRSTATTSWTSPWPPSAGAIGSCTATGTVTAHGPPDLGSSSHVATMPSGSPAIARSIESHPTESGYWVLWTDGYVDAHNLTDHGSANRDGFGGTEYVGSIRRTHDGGGYWITSGSGIVQAFGNAPSPGQRTALPRRELVDGVVLGPDTLCPVRQRLRRPVPRTATCSSLQATGSTSGPSAKATELCAQTETTKITPISYGSCCCGPAGTSTRTHRQAQRSPTCTATSRSTGSWSRTSLPDTMFDKRPVIEAIKGSATSSATSSSSTPKAASGSSRPPGGRWGTTSSTARRSAHAGDRRDRPAHGHRSLSAASRLAPRSSSPPTTRADRRRVNPSTRRPRTPPSSARRPRGTWRARSSRRCGPRRVQGAGAQVMANLLDMKMWFYRRTARSAASATRSSTSTTRSVSSNARRARSTSTTSEAVSLTHDLTSGDFTMSLTTHWLGGSPYGVSHPLLHR